MLRLILAPAPVHFTNLERGGSVLPEKMNHLTTALFCRVELDNFTSFDRFSKFHVVFEIL